MTSSIFLRTLPAILFLFLPFTQAHALDQLKVSLDWYINPNHGALLAAQKMGYFSDAGLEVELLPPSDPSDPPKLVAASKVDIGISYHPQLLSYVTEGLPLVRIGALIDTPLNTVMALADGPIKTIDDLQGRTIGYSLGGFDDILLSLMVAKEGTTPNVTLVNVNFSLMPALLSGQVDAIIGGYRTVEAHSIREAGKEPRQFFVEEYGIPAYDELVLIAHSDRRNDPRLERFLEALERGVLYVLNHPDQGWAFLIEGRKELDTPANYRSWLDTLPRLAAAPAALDRQRYNRFADFLFQNKIIRHIPPLDSYCAEPSP